MGTFIAINRSRQRTYLYLRDSRHGVARAKPPAAQTCTACSLSMRGTERELRLEKPLGMAPSSSRSPFGATIVSWDFAMTLMPSGAARSSTVLRRRAISRSSPRADCDWRSAYFNLERYLDPSTSTPSRRSLTMSRCVLLHFHRVSRDVYGNEAPRSVSSRFPAVRAALLLRVVCTSHPVPDSAIRSADDPADLLRVLLHPRRHVAGEVPHHRADADTPVPAVQLRHVLAVAHRGVNRGRYPWIVRAPVFPVRQVQPDDFDLGVPRRAAGRLEARRRNARADFVGQTVPAMFTRSLTSRSWYS